jgi:hypothetical protein
MKDEKAAVASAHEYSYRVEDETFHPSAFILHPLKPPWFLRGSAIVMLCRLSPSHRRQSLLPFGIRALVHYEYSPVGAYDEMAIAVLSRRGPTVVQMPVTSELSMMSGRANWGFPKTLLRMSWKRRGNKIEFRTTHQTFRARTFGVSIPLKLRLVSTQMLNQKRVRVPIAIGARARLAFCGRQLAVCVENFEMMVKEPV